MDLTFLSWTTIGIRQLIALVYTLNYLVLYALVNYQQTEVIYLANMYLMFIFRKGDAWVLNCLFVVYTIIN